VVECAGYFAGQDTQQYYHHRWDTTVSVTYLATLSVPASYSADVIIIIIIIIGIIITGRFR
jgi:hypothetical protein